MKNKDIKTNEKSNKKDKKDIIVKKEKEENKGTGKWIKNTSLTVLLILIIIAICILINLAVEKANFSDIDVTADKVYSLSEKSIDIAKSIDKDVEIMLINMGETEKEFANKYASLNKKIKLDIIDDVSSRTDLTDEYGITADTSVIIIKCGDKEKILSSSDLYTIDYSTYETKDTTEEALTNAIISVTTDENPVIYTLTGHNKYPSDYMYFFTQDLESEAYEVNELDILTTGSVPKDCSVLMITTLSEDLTKKERDEIIKYIDKGGKIILFADPNATGKKMPYFQDVLDEYGVSLSEGKMLERDTNRMLYNTPSAILVTVSENTSVTRASDMNMKACFMTSGRIEIADSSKLEKLNVEVETLATTGENSFYRTDYDIDDSEGFTNSDEEDGYATVGALLKKTVDEDKTSELIVYANNMFITNMVINSSQGNAYVLDYYNNEDLAMNSIAYLADRDNMITIRKNVEVTAYTVTEQQNMIILAIIFAIPLFSIIIGIVVWLVRRRK